MAFKLAGHAREFSDLKRALTQRQLTMMTIGGAIGVGLFLGSSVTIRLAGPGVILSYLFSAVIALIVAYSIAEMAVTHPVAGSFGVYAQTYLNAVVRLRGSCYLRLRSNPGHRRGSHGRCNLLFRLVPVGSAMGLGCWSLGRV